MPIICQRGYLLLTWIHDGIPELLFSYKNRHLTCLPTCLHERIVVTYRNENHICILTYREDSMPYAEAPHMLGYKRANCSVICKLPASNCQSTSNVTKSATTGTSRAHRGRQDSQTQQQIVRTCRLQSLFSRGCQIRPKRRFLRFFGPPEKLGGGGYL